jgi:hypothetical protein
MRQGSPVEVHAEDGRIALTPAGRRLGHELTRLVARINRRNRPAPPLLASSTRSSLLEPLVT